MIFQGTLLVLFNKIQYTVITESKIYPYQNQKILSLHFMLEIFTRNRKKNISHTELFVRPAFDILVRKIIYDKQSTEHSFAA